MTILFSIIFTILAIALIGVIIILIRQTKQENSEKQVELVKKILEEKEFITKKIYYITDSLIIAINKKENKLGVIDNFQIDTPQNAKFYSIGSASIVSIYKTPMGINIDYLMQGNKITFPIPTKNKEIEDIIHKMYKDSYIKKLEEKYLINSFLYTASSDWECSYVWAYRPLHTTFAYYKTGEKKAIYKLNLLKEFFTIDVKLEYFEAPILGTAQQLSIYESSFLNDIFLSLLNVIKQKCSAVVDNRIYFDSYNDAVYITNGKSSLQSILLKQIEEVMYKQDRLTFSLKDKDKLINFPADRYMLDEFENFITSYNLRKIATTFDYNIDKLINTTEGTKFIVDNTRNRVVYCAGLNSLSKFTYMTILFNNLEYAKVVKIKDGYFVRIYTKDKEIVDVSCKKSSVAQYILAQITTITGA